MQFRRRQAVPINFGLGKGDAVGCLREIIADRENTKATAEAVPEPSVMINAKRAPPSA